MKVAVADAGATTICDIVPLEGVAVAVVTASDFGRLRQPGKWLKVEDDEVSNRAP